MRSILGKVILMKAYPETLDEYVFSEFIYICINANIINQMQRRVLVGTCFNP